MLEKIFRSVFLAIWPLESESFGSRVYFLWVCRFDFEEFRNRFPHEIAVRIEIETDFIVRVRIVKNITYAPFYTRKSDFFKSNLRKSCNRRLKVPRLKPCFLIWLDMLRSSSYRFFILYHKDTPFLSNSELFSICWIYKPLGFEDSLKIWFKSEFREPREHLCFRSLEDFCFNFWWVGHKERLRSSSYKEDSAYFLNRIR